MFFDYAHPGCISIHALLAESDKCSFGNPYKKPYFYPRSPCGERLEKVPADVYYQAFLSTLSLRRATTDAINGCNPDIISIHALLAESDYLGARKSCNVRDFYPRSPCGERPTNNQLEQQERHISIHALLAESDWLFLLPFYTRQQFLSTLSLRRATLTPSMGVILILFLSTLSLRRATAALCQALSSKLYFYPRSPCGERPPCVGWL